MSSLKIKQGLIRVNQDVLVDKSVADIFVGAERVVQGGQILDANRASQDASGDYVLRLFGADVRQVMQLTDVDGVIEKQVIQPLQITDFNNDGKSDFLYTQQGSLNHYVMNVSLQQGDQRFLTDTVEIPSQRPLSVIDSSYVQSQQGQQFNQNAILLQDVDTHILYQRVNVTGASAGQLVQSPVESYPVGSVNTQIVNGLEEVQSMNQNVDVRLVSANADVDGNGINEVVWTAKQVGQQDQQVVVNNQVVHDASGQETRLSPNQSIVGVSDATGDGKSDVIVQTVDPVTKDMTLSVLQMNGSEARELPVQAQLVDAQGRPSFTAIPEGYRVVDTRADVNGDRASDIILQDQAGNVVQISNLDQLVQGRQAESSVLRTDLGLRFEIVSAHEDFNGDNISDMLVRDLAQKDAQGNVMTDAQGNMVVDQSPATWISLMKLDADGIVRVENSVVLGGNQQGYDGWTVRSGQDLVDFNGDAKTDVLLTNVDGRVALAEINPVDGSFLDVRITTSYADIGYNLDAVQVVGSPLNVIDAPMV